MVHIYFTIQIIGIFVLIIELLYLTMQYNSKAQIWLIFFTLSTLLNSIGHLLGLTSTSKAAAIVAAKVTYIGKVYIMLTMFVFILYYMEIKVHRLIIMILFFIQTAIIICVMTCDKNKLFYTSIQWVRENGYAHLILSHGVVYFVYMGIVASYIVTLLICCLMQKKKVQNSKEWHQVLYVIFCSLIPVVALVIYSTGITGGYDITAPGYVIASILLLVSYFKYRLLDTLEVAKDNVVDNLNSGAIVLNNYHQLLYVNELAKTLLPNIEDKHNEELIGDLQVWADSKSIREKNNKIYSCSCKNIYFGTKKRGSMILIEDVTSNYNYTQRLEHAVRERTESIRNIQNSIIFSLANMVEARDGVTGLHVKRTSDYVKIICIKMQEDEQYHDIMTDTYVTYIVNAAPLHDIGKIAIPDVILQKPGKLTEEEFNVIKTHSVYGANMVKELLKEVEEEEYLKIAQDVAHYHHEKWDGTGYPCGLKGTNIPLPARIMAISDVYDALRAKRSYKEAYSKEETITIIKEGSGKSFDPGLVRIFLKVRKEIEAASEKNRTF